ncbi:MAG: DUF3137 domain-containing protein [Mobilitalea sp.]
MNDEMLYLENLRNKAATTISFVIAVPVVTIIVSLFVITPISSSTVGLYSSLFIGAAMGLLLYKFTGCMKLYKDYKAYFKSLLVEVPFRKAFDQVIYDVDLGFEQEIIEKTDMMSLGNRYYTNDYVQGNYKAVKFERADVKIQMHVGSGKHSHTTTYFHGRWLIFEFNKEFHFDLQIIGKGFNYSKKNRIADKEERRHRIEMEDINFNENFEVFGQDDHEAFYILTPQFMAVLQTMRVNMDGSFMFGFVDNQLHIAINNDKDAMEPHIFSGIELSSILAEVQGEINAIISIIDELSLDRDICKN